MTEVESYRCIKVQDIIKQEGGSIHTDNVNIPERWDYLIFSCLAKAEVGGETILVNSKEVYNLLERKYKFAKKILSQNFYWEKRGLIRHYTKLQ